MKNLFLDVETTGINPEIHAIIQLSGIITIDDQIVEKFNFKLKPHPGAIIDPAALEITHFSSQDLDNFTPAYQIFGQFIQILEKYVSPFDKKDKFFFIAYNSRFDEDFIRQFFLRNDSQYYASYFWTPSLDVMALALEYLKEKRENMPNFRLITVAKFLGLNLDENAFHDALYDIEIAKDIYHLITEMFCQKKSLSQESLSTTETIPQNTLEGFSSSQKEAKKEFFDSLF